MRFWAFALISLFAARAAAEPAWVEPGTRVVEAPPPRVGECIGGDCAPERASAQTPLDTPPTRSRPANHVARFAYAGALLGVVSAGLSIGGAIAIAAVDDVSSERVTRGLWLGQLALATPVVALSAYLARRGSDYQGYRGLRTLGWVAYGAAVSDGVLLWYSAFHDMRLPAGLTIAAGAIGVFAVLPHALDAFVSGRKARRRLALAPSGLGVRF